MISVAMITYNGLPFLPAQAASILDQLSDQDELIISDDGSTDGTAQVALEHGADYVLRHRSNRGLSKAFISGIQFALALGADIIVNTDADHQYPGKEIEHLIQPILAGEADLVIGDRQPQHNRNFSPWKRFWRNSVVRLRAKSLILTPRMRSAVFELLPLRCFALAGL